MLTKLRITPFALAPTLALAIALAIAFATAPFGSPPASAQEAATARADTCPLVGAWRMTSLEVNIGGDFVTVPYSGQIIFTESCTMSVQAMHPDPNAPATPYTTNGYEAFYGTVAVDETAKRFFVTVESSLVRDLIGQSMARGYDVSGDTLVLTPADPAEGWRVTYQRF